MAEILAATGPTDWRPLDPENTLVLELAAGRVILELAPAFAPGHVANVKAVVREGYFDGLTINRAQENYVVQWGDAAEEPEGRRKIQKAKETLPAEFFRALSADGYRGVLSLETHWRGAGTPEASTRQSMKGLKELLKRAESHKTA